MNPGLLICKTFLEVSPLKKNLMKHLAVEEAQKIAALYALPFNIFSQNLDEMPLEKLHPSWLAPILRGFSEKEIFLFLEALSEDYAKALEKELLLTKQTLLLSEKGKKFLRKYLWERVIGNDIPPMPIPLLPSSSLDPLLSVSYQEMDLLISLLAMHDLASEMRLIIDTKKIRSIQALLSKEQSNFIRSLIQHKTALSFGKMQLASWKEDAPTLQTMLTQRGINRLAKACSDSQSSFKWYATHLLHEKHAQMFYNLCTKVQDQAKEILIDQVLEIIQYIKRKI